MIWELIRNKIQSNFWDIGFVEKDLREVLSSDRLDVHWMKHSYNDNVHKKKNKKTVTNDDEAKEGLYFESDFK